MFNKQNLKNMDVPFVVAVLLLLATSLIVLSTASYNLVKGQPYYCRASNNVDYKRNFLSYYG